MSEEWEDIETVPSRMPLKVDADALDVYRRDDGTIEVQLMAFEGTADPLIVIASMDPEAMLALMDGVRRMIHDA